MKISVESRLFSCTIYKISRNFSEAKKNCKYMQSPFKQEIIGDIFAKLQESLHLWYGKNATLAFEQPQVEIMRYSFILQFQINNPDCKDSIIIVKIDRCPDDVNIEQAISKKDINLEAQQEYFLMKSIEKVIKKVDLPELDAVKMLAYFPEWNAIVMEKLPGITLREHFVNKNMLLNLEKECKLILKASYHSGKWLRIFHNQVGKMSWQPLVIDEWLEKVRVDFEYTYPNFDKDADVSSLFNNFRQSAEKLAGYPVQYSILHGDFHMKNILVMEDGSVAGFDPHSYSRGPVYDDLTRMAIDTMTLKFHILSLGLLVNKKLNKKCLSSFLKGYFTGEEFNQDIFSLFTASAYLKKWRDDEVQLRKFTKNKLIRRIVSFFVRIYFVKSIRNELANVKI